MEKTTPLGIKKLSNWKMVLSTFLSELKQVDYLALKASESLLSLKLAPCFSWMEGRNIEKFLTADAVCNFQSVSHMARNRPHFSMEWRWWNCDLFFQAGRFTSATMAQISNVSLCVRWTCTLTGHMHIGTLLSSGNLHKRNPSISHMSTLLSAV